MKGKWLSEKEGDEKMKLNQIYRKVMIKDKDVRKNDGMKKMETMQRGKGKEKYVTKIKIWVKRTKKTHMTSRKYKLRKERKCRKRTGRRWKWKNEIPERGGEKRLGKGE